MTIFDQFVSSGESKWSRMNGLAVLLPHGYEGQGPEHSSARLERFLQLCAEYNMIVTNVTMPANFFHLMRRQLAWNFRKPLVNMAPKSGLRHAMAVSPVEDFGPGTRFQEIIDDPTVTKTGNKKVSGKGFWLVYSVILCCEILNPQAPTGAWGFRISQHKIMLTQIRAGYSPHY